MSSARWWMAGVLASSLAIACGPGGTGPGPDAGDTGSGGDTMMQGDTGGGTDGGSDGGGTDARADTRPDVPPPIDPCMASRIIDLTMMTPGMDGNIRFMGNSSMASETGGITAPESCVGMGEKAHQVILRYRMRATAVLRVSTDNAGTARTFDTVVAIANRCAPDAMVLACNDDNGSFMAGMIRSTAQTPSPVMMGTEVFIAVGGFNPPVGMNVAQGAFELTVREITPVAVGGMCTSMDVCAMGSTCVPTLADPTRGTCVANGGQGTPCNLMAPFCNMGLTCSVMMPTMTNRGVCRATVPPGMPCDPRGRQTVCAMGAVCGLVTATTGVCVMPRMEMEPNNTPMMAQAPVTMNTTYQGSLMPGSDVDCFGVTVPAMGSLILETSDGNGGCPAMADTILRLYNPAGMMIAENDDAAGRGLCSFIDGSTMGPANRLAAGNYTVCVSSFGMMPMPVASYHLNIAIRNP